MNKVEDYIKTVHMNNGTPQNTQGFRLVPNGEWSAKFVGLMDSCGFIGLRHHQINLPDSVICPVCCIGIRFWNPNCNPAVVHAAFSPNCPMLKRDWYIQREITCKSIPITQELLFKMLHSDETLEGRIRQIMFESGIDYGTMELALARQLFLNSTNHHSLSEYHSHLQNSKELQKFQMTHQLPLTVECITNICIPSLKPKTDFSQKILACIVCDKVTVSVMLFPCMHAVVCQFCKYRCMKCPKCNTDISSSFNIAVAVNDASSRMSYNTHVPPPPLPPPPPYPDRSSNPSPPEASIVGPSDNESFNGYEIELLKPQLETPRRRRRRHVIREGAAANTSSSTSAAAAAATVCTLPPVNDVHIISESQNIPNDVLLPLKKRRTDSSSSTPPSVTVTSLKTGLQGSLPRLKQEQQLLLQEPPPLLLMNNDENEVDNDGDVMENDDGDSSSSSSANTTTTAAVSTTTTTSSSSSSVGESRVFTAVKKAVLSEYIKTEVLNGDDDFIISNEPADDPYPPNFLDVTIKTEPDD